MTMRSHADVGWPDGEGSPGTIWLASLYDSVDEAWNYGRFESEDDQDVVSELADPDSLHPYTHDAWSVFVDLVAWESPEASDDDVRPQNTAGDPTMWVRTVLALIAERAMLSWVEERRDREESA